MLGSYNTAVRSMNEGLTQFADYCVSMIYRREVRVRLSAEDRACYLKQRAAQAKEWRAFLKAILPKKLIPSSIAIAVNLKARVQKHARSFLLFEREWKFKNWCQRLA